MDSETQQTQDTAEAAQPAAQSGPPDARASGARLKKRHIAARVLLVLLFAIGVYFSLLPMGRANVRAALLLPALITQQEPPPLKALGPPVRHTQMTLPATIGTTYLDIYAPDAPAPLIPGEREGVLMIPGVGDNRNVEQLVNLSQSLARTGVVVMNFTTTTLLDYDLDPSDSDALVRAFQTLQHLPGVGPERVGIVGFSAGGALAVLAAADPRIRDNIAFITLFGGYFDTTSLLQDFGRRAITVDGKSQPWIPQLVPVQVLANVMAGTLPLNEGNILTNAFANSITPDISDNQLSQLSPPALAAFHLLAGDQPENVDANIAALSPGMRELLTSLAPSAFVAKVKTPIYLLHDRNDEFVPFTQSRDFAAALTKLNHPHEFAEFGIFAHVEVRTGLSITQLLGDAGALFRVVSLLLLPAS
ncbi:MAG: hypothetical protein OJF49_001271 [Ktedonobacterales bacterium]|nr:MAG: hypothetical protein OJF49_001271 [Ktedonobacterales bacterium]